MIEEGMRGRVEKGGGLRRNEGGKVEGMGGSVNGAKLSLLS